MRLDFSDTTNKDGILQLIETELGYPDGYITGDATRLAKFTSLVNRSISSAWDIIFDVAYGWQPDDINHTDYPIQFFNLVLGQRDYSVTNKEDRQEIYEILKVAVKDPSGVFHELKSLDQQARQSGNNDVSSFIDGQNTMGTPTRYDKTATGIFLDPIPNYSSALGVKIMVQREGSYFTTTDTTKKPGFDGRYHEWCVIEPCYKIARANKLSDVERFKRDMQEMEQKIRDGYGRRDRDMFRRLQANVEETQ